MNEQANKRDPAMAADETILTARVTSAHAWLNTRLSADRQAPTAFRLASTVNPGGTRAPTLGT